VGLDLAPGRPPSDPAPTIEYDILRDDPTPELAGLTLDGHRFNLSDWRGFAVMINFWASWCEPCRAELRHLADASARWSTQGLRVVTLNTRDDGDAARSLLAEVGATDLPAVVDPDGDIAATWRVHALPQTLLIDRDGRIRLQRLGPVTAAWLDREVPALLSESTHGSARRAARDGSGRQPPPSRAPWKAASRWKAAKSLSARNCSFVRPRRRA
jgi:cytochrome c biogenesis protein CcmG/thiol:disulfide interchange protein DsbE